MHYLDIPGVRPIVESIWRGIPDHFARAALDEFVIMPNHLHGVLWLLGEPDAIDKRAVGSQHAETLRPGILPGSLSAVLRSFKSAITAEVRRQDLVGSEPFWQHNFYGRVVRDEEELNRIRQYIRLNPTKWALDAENPDRTIDDAYDKEWSWLEAQTVISHPL